MTDACLCGHFRNLHHRDRNCCATSSCPCDRFEVDPGGDGSTSNPGPDFRADQYDGIYGANRRWERP